MCISTIDIRNKSSLEWRLRWNRWEMFFFRERKTWKCNLPMNFSMYMKGWILHWLCYWTWNSRWTDYSSCIFAFTCFRAGHKFLGELMVTSKWSHDYTCVTFGRGIESVICLQHLSIYQQLVCSHSILVDNWQFQVSYKLYVLRLFTFKNKVLYKQTFWIQLIFVM